VQRSRISTAAYKFGKFLKGRTFGCDGLQPSEFACHTLPQSANPLCRLDLFAVFHRDRDKLPLS
jgi:hypothetical protein